GPRYPISRPAVVAPAQRTSDTIATRLARGEVGLRSSSAGSRKSRFLYQAMLTTPSEMNAILTANTGFASLVVASAIRRTTPEAALIQNPAHIHGKSFFIGASGMLLATPRIRRSIATLTPTRNARPTVCRNSTVGYAQIVGASRTHVPKPLCSSDERTCMRG